MTRREILFEMRRVGTIVRVTAVDPDTGAEATIQGPASAGTTVLEQAAAAKLRYVLSRSQASPPAGR